MNIETGKDGIQTLIVHGLEQVVTKDEALLTAAVCGIPRIVYGPTSKPIYIEAEHSAEAKKGIIPEAFRNALDLKVERETGHVVRYPARQYCANCNAALFTAEGLAKCNPKKWIKQPIQE